MLKHPRWLQASQVVFLSQGNWTFYMMAGSRDRGREGASPPKSQTVLPQSPLVSASHQASPAQGDGNNLPLADEEHAHAE